MFRNSLGTVIAVSQIDLQIGLQPAVVTSQAKAKKSDR
jgi:hypothetical protein